MEKLKAKLRKWLISLVREAVQVTISNELAMAYPRLRAAANPHAHLDDFKLLRTSFTLHDRGANPGMWRPDYAYLYNEKLDFCKRQLFEDIMQHVTVESYHLTADNVRDRIVEIGIMVRKPAEVRHGKLHNVHELQAKNI